MNFYPAIVILFRLAGVGFFLKGFYTLTITLFLMGGLSEIRSHFSSIFALFLPFAAGIILWLIAKPMGRLITKGI